MLGLRGKYESYHKCRYTLEAINAAVYLSARYISDRFLPDKAIDLIDEAGSRARMELHKQRKEQQTCILSKSPREYWHEIRAVQIMHQEVMMTLFSNIGLKKRKYTTSIDMHANIGNLSLSSSLD